MADFTPAALTIIEACDYIRVSRATLYRLVRNGDLVISRVGGKSLVRRVDADAMLEKGLSKAQQKVARASGPTPLCTPSIFG